MDANIISYLFSVGAYLYFFCGFCSYHIWFAAPELVHSLPPSIVEGINFFAPSDFYGKAAADTSSAILTDIALMLLFIVPHTIFANNMLRTKDILPTCLERPFFVLQAQLMLHIQMMYWKPFGVTLYDVRGTPLGTTLSALSTVGFAFILTSSFALDHFHLFGISQGFGVDVNKMVGLTPSDTSEGGLSTRWHYSIVAHPIMAGILFQCWACPRMTSSRLLFNLISTMYCVGGPIMFEEVKLEAELGKEYDDYLHTVPRFCPFTSPAKRMKKGKSA